MEVSSRNEINHSRQHSLEGKKECLFQKQNCGFSVGERTADGVSLRGQWVSLPLHSAPKGACHWQQSKTQALSYPSSVPHALCPCHQVSLSESLSALSLWQSRYTPCPLGHHQWQCFAGFLHSSDNAACSQNHTMHVIRVRWMRRCRNIRIWTQTDWDEFFNTFPESQQAPYMLSGWVADQAG